YRPKYYNKVVGVNFRLDAIQAAVVQVKLKYLDQWTEARQRNAAYYRDLFAEADLSIRPESVATLQSAGNNTVHHTPSSSLANVSGVVLPTEAPNRRHIYNQFVI